MAKLSRAEAREALFGLMFEMEFQAEGDPREIYQRSCENREIPEDAYIRKAFFAILSKCNVIDAVIGKYSKGWKAERLSKVSRSVLRIAVYEMLFEDLIPYSVTINEAVELTKKFDDEKARPFVNGVLNSVKNKLEAEGKTK